jgi:hypothetical protein
MTVLVITSAGAGWQADSNMLAITSKPKMMVILFFMILLLREEYKFQETCGFLLTTNSTTYERGFGKSLR